MYIYPTLAIKPQNGKCITHTSLENDIVSLGNRLSNYKTICPFQLNIFINMKGVVSG